MNKNYDINSTDDSLNDFEQQYISLRKKEGRLYTDEEVAMLPGIDASHHLKKEWKIRKASCDKLVKYLSKKQKPLKILEVGCGNGWLSYQLSLIPDTTVTGLDINFTELQQANRVFVRQANLNFIYERLELIKEQFDVIVFAASIQYFSSFHEIIKTALDHLNAEGEIHVLDSHFYAEKEAEAAVQRSEAYFSSAGFNQMKHFYFHHCLYDLNNYRHDIIYNPNSFIHKLFNKRNPFYWICIKHN